MYLRKLWMPDVQRLRGSFLSLIIIKDICLLHLIIFIYKK